MSGTLRLRGSTSGYSELQAPAVAADQTFVLPTAGGTLLTTDSPVPKLTLELGSASQPSLTFQGDTDTGLFSEGTNTLNLVTGGSSKVVLGAAAHTIYAGTGATVRAIDIDSSGRVLIGTTTEGHANADNLTLADSGSCGLTLRSATNNFGRIYFSDGTTGDAEYRGIIQYDHTNNRMQFAANASTAMTIDSSGNVGINTTSPATYGARNLEVNGGSGGAYLVVKGANNADIGELAADGDIYLSAKTSSALIFRTADTQRMRIDSSGNVGIGQSPNFKLNILHADEDGIRLNTADGAASFIDFGDTSDNDIGRISYDHADNHMAFRTNNSERARIDSSGRLLVGTSSFTGEASAVLEGSSAGGTTQAQLWLNRGSTPATDNVLGQIIFGDNTATGRNGAMIQARADLSWNANDYPSRLAFFTTADGASSPTERMRIDSSGRVGDWGLLRLSVA